MWAKFKNPLLICYPWFWFDFFILERLIMIVLNKWVPFSNISMNFILFVFLYIRNTWKTTIMTFIKGQCSVQTPITTWSSSLWGCISGTSTRWTTPTYVLKKKFGIMWPWDMSHPQKPLGLFNAIFCLGFFGLNNIADCPIANYRPHQTQFQPTIFLPINAIGVWSQIKYLKLRSKGSACLLCASLFFGTLYGCNHLSLQLSLGKKSRFSTIVLTTFWSWKRHFQL
jgi:hypothetical protein